MKVTGCLLIMNVKYSCIEIQPTIFLSGVYFYRAIRMSRYRDSGSSDCKLYVGDLGKMLCKFIYIYLFGYMYFKFINEFLLVAISD
jgi:hypothetical protein